MMVCVQSDLSSDDVVVGLLAHRICRVGQNHIYTVYIRCFWQRNHQKYGHIRCIYTVLANPTYMYAVYDRIFGGFPCPTTVYTPFMTVYLVTSPAKLLYINMVLANSTWF